MSVLVAVDPGLRCTGVAVFADRKLISCASIVGSKDTTVDVLARIRYVGEEVRRFCVGLLNTRIIGGTLVVEWPQMYTHGSADRNDVLPLAGLDGYLAAALSPDVLRSVRPAEWKGNVPKPNGGKETRKNTDKYPIKRRVQRILLPDEQYCVHAHGLTWDAFDAVGIGLWALGRAKKGLVRHVYPGATEDAVEGDF